MKAIANRLFKMRATLHWRTDRLCISAGTTWVTIGLSGEQPARIRGAGLATLRSGLEIVLNPGLAINRLPIASGIVAATTSRTHHIPGGGDRPLVTLEFDGAPAELKNPLGTHSSLADLLQWLQLLDGTAGFPLGESYDGTAQGKGQVDVLSDQTAWPIPPGQTGALAETLLSPPGTRVSLCPGFSLYQTRTKTLLTFGNESVALSRTAAAHLAATLEAP